MRIFLAGAGGVQGSRLIPRLRKRGHEVTGLTRSEAGAARIRVLSGGYGLGETKKKKEPDPLARTRGVGPWRPGQRTRGG